MYVSADSDRTFLHEHPSMSSSCHVPWGIECLQLVAHLTHLAAPLVPTSNAVSVRRSFAKCMRTARSTNLLYRTASARHSLPAACSSSSFLSIHLEWELMQVPSRATSDAAPAACPCLRPSSNPFARQSRADTRGWTQLVIQQPWWKAGVVARSKEGCAEVYILFIGVSRLKVLDSV